MMDYSRVLSDKIINIKPSGIRKFFDLLEDTKDAISLGVGEPDFATPWLIRDAGIFSLEKGYTKYTPNAGIRRLRKEISKYMERRFNLSYDPLTQTLVTVGGSEAIDLTVRALVNPGDEVIIPEPCFVCYAPITELAGGVPVIIRTKAENRFKLTGGELRAAITDKTKLLILPFPNNPTGAIMEKNELLELAEVLSGTDIMVLSDEIYAELTYGNRHVSMASLESMYDRVIVVNGFSKSYAMTGWRLGYACGPAQIISQMTKIHQYAVMCAPTVSQYAAIEAVKSCDGEIEKMRDEYDRRRRMMLEGFRSIGLDCFEPEGAFYIFPSIKNTGLTSEEFCERLLMQKKIAVIPGTAFGESGEGFVRCCYASSVQNLQTALTRIEEFKKELCCGQ